MLGLKRGTVVLFPHQTAWEEHAKDTIALLWTVLDGIAVDIQHVGSTAICGIHAKPIIDIAVDVKKVDDVKPYIEALQKAGIVYRKQDVEGQILFVMGDFENDFRTHHIHVVEWNSVEWNHYINFRDYLNAFSEKAKIYDALKSSLAERFAENRGCYTSGKHELIDRLLQEAKAWRENLDK